jgi:hypothetical protein
MFKISYFGAYSVNQLTRVFDDYHDAIEYLDKLYKVIYWEEDDRHPWHFDVAVAKGPSGTYSVEPIVCE